MEGVRKCSCSRTWRITKHHTPMRDKDTAECYCGEILASWNGGVFYMIKLIQDIDKKDEDLSHN
ncbi:hypothetical protein J2T12_003950 [Paenibacillus anaericanus]|uniref:hypothetical protein n=1 Tax=Paenibacillus anaericanus TaxID=170367 RepID=UPI002789F620|nr:hypothetical protein [Paenibacillus anaericanus]MDQ0090527.1 hypothetical protein [Paenibacillus anaericanus]